MYVCGMVVGPQCGDNGDDAVADDLLLLRIAHTQFIFVCMRVRL